MRRRHGSFTITDEVDRIDLDAAYRFLSEDSYWSNGIPRQVFDRAVRGSMVFGALDDADGDGAGPLAAFTRVATDRATFAWVCDVFVLPPHRGRGLGKAMLGTVMAHPELQGLRRWMLGTKDAHGLYARFGFERLEPWQVERLMAVWRTAADVYGEGPGA